MIQLARLIALLAAATLTACAAAGDAPVRKAPAPFNSGKYLDLANPAPTGELDEPEPQERSALPAEMRLSLTTEIASVRPAGYTELDERCARAAQGPFGGDLALQQCRQALKQPQAVSENQALAAYHLSLIHTQMAQFRQAVEAAEAALAIDPALADAHLARAAALIELGRTAEAEGAIAAGLAGEPEYPHYAYYLRGVMHDMKNEFVPAYLELKRAVEMRPGWTPAQRRLESLSYATDVRNYLAREG